MAQFCTEELKTLPITLQVVGPMLKRGPVLQWLGIRAEESKNRAKQPRFNHRECGSMVWRPLLRWSLDEVWAMHRKHGIEPNPLYAQGMGRVGCMPCINCKKEELRQVAQRFPEHIERIAEWERIVGEANKRNRATFFGPDKDAGSASAAARGEYAGIHIVAEWARTTRGGRQFGMFFDRQPCGGCTSDPHCVRGKP